MKHSADTLAKCEQIINEKIKTSENSLIELRSLLKSTNEAQAHSETWDTDNAACCTDTEILCIQITRTSEFIHKLKNALIRCKNGSYGVCRTTGELIPKERLFAQPCATELAVCKN